MGCPPSWADAIEDTATPLRRIPHAVRDGHLPLVAVERQVCDTLLATVKHFGLKTTVRVAGGWVRDRLLQLDTLDIDVALDDMMGCDFAELVNKYLESQVGCSSSS